MKRLIQTIPTVILAFAIIAVLLVRFEATPRFPDPDSFYHAKMALIIRDQGFIQTFPWFQETTWKDAYVDPHLLYHILLIPFVTVFDPLVGMKVSAIVFGLVAFLALWLSLKSVRSPAPALLTLAAALCTLFLNRIAFPRAIALSVALILFSTWAILRRRALLTFCCAAIFAWYYHGYPVLILSIGAAVCAELATRWLVAERPFRLAVRETVGEYGKTVAGALGGMLFALVVNPYFPQNIAFSIVDIVKIGIINYRSILPVGTEWRPADPLELALHALPVALLVGCTLVLFLISLRYRRDKGLPHPSQERMSQVLTYLFLAGGYFILTIKSVRYGEYAIPFTVIACGGILSLAEPFLRDEILPFLRAQTRPERWRGVATVLACAILIATIPLNLSVKQERPHEADPYVPVALWLEENVPPHDIVFANVWDTNSILFYLDDAHYYLLGLDPTFMYDKSPERYWTWYDIVNGKTEDVTPIITTFGAHTVMVDKDMVEHGALMKHLDASGLFLQVMDSEHVALYTCVSQSLCAR